MCVEHPKRCARASDPDSRAQPWRGKAGRGLMPAVQRFAGGCRSFMSPAISTSARDCASRFIHTENVAMAALLAATSSLPLTSL